MTCKSSKAHNSGFYNALKGLQSTSTKELSWTHRERRGPGEGKEGAISQEVGEGDSGEGAGSAVAVEAADWAAAAGGPVVGSSTAAPLTPPFKML